MEIRFLGTGASDHDWTRLGAADVRGSAGALIHGRLLIDCGATGLDNLARFGVAFGAVEALLITHSHDDHFDPAQVARLAADAGRSAPLVVYAAPAVLAALDGATGIDPRPIRPGDGFDVAECRVTALPANHNTDLPGEEALHFAFESAAGNLLYALDGAGLLKRAVRLIQSLRFDRIVIDCTMAESGDWRIFEHNDLETVVHLMRSLRAMGIADAQTLVVLNHLARSLWPESQAACRARVTGTGFLVAYDGMRLGRDGEVE